MVSGANAFATLIEVFAIFLFIYNDDSFNVSVLSQNECMSMVIIFGDADGHCLEMCGKSKFGSYLVFEKIEPSKNLTSVQTVF